MIITLPWPPSALSGHAKGHWHGKSAKTKSVRKEAARITGELPAPKLPDKGDIPVTVIFYPPNRRGDRVNFPIRIKPFWDGIADALGVNDARFIPTFIYAQPGGEGRVEFLLGGRREAA